MILCMNMFLMIISILLYNIDCITTYRTLSVAIILCTDFQMEDMLLIAYMYNIYMYIYTCSEVP